MLKLSKFGIKTYYQLIVRDKKGKVIRKTRKKLSRSWVIQFLEILDCHLTATTRAITDDTNTEVSYTGSKAMNAEAAAGDVTKGIVVGTGTTPEDDTDYALETKVAHGAGAGQLNYGAQSHTDAAIVGVNVDFIFTRTFTNASGGSIAVTEIGILVHASTTTTYHWLIIHDVFAAVDVGNGQTLTVEYTIRTTV